MSVIDNMYYTMKDKEKYIFNYWIGKGYAQHEMKEMESRLSILLSDVCLKPDGDVPWLEFVSLRKLTAKEEFEEITRKGTLQFLDITKSDFVMYEYHFIYHHDGRNTEIKKYQYLPAVNWRDSSLRISGTKWYLMPIWTDPKLAPVPTGIGLFSKLYKNKAKILNDKHLYLVNGIKKLKSFIYMENFYTINKIEKNLDPSLKNLNPPLAAFLLVNNTLKKALSKYDNGSQYGVDLTLLKGKYEREKGYKYISSTKEQHPQIKDPYPERHDYTIRVAEDSSHLVYEMAYSLIYMFDAKPELADRAYDSIGTKYELDAWRLLLGFVTFKGAFDTTYTIQTLQEHMRKVDSYIDTLISKDMYNDLGIKVNDISDYIKEIIRVYPELTTKGQNYYKVVRDKKMEILYYVIYILVNKINKNIDDINQRIYFNKDFSLKHVQQVLKNTFRPKELFNISKGGSEQILPLALFNTTRDNRIYGVNTLMDVQERGLGPFKQVSKSNKFPASLKVLAGIDTLRGTMNYLYKGAPSIRLRASPLNKWKDGNIEFTDDLIEIMDKLDRELNQYRDDAITEQLLNDMDETLFEEEGEI